MNLTEGADVFRDASRMIERLNGAALLIHGDGKPVKLGQTMKFDPSGKREPVIVAASLAIILQGARARGRAAVISTDKCQIADVVGLSISGVPFKIGLRKNVMKLQPVLLARMIKPDGKIRTPICCTGALKR